MTRQFIVTAPIEYRRHDFEESFECTSAAADMDAITEIMEANPDFQLWDLQDFVEYCNNEVFDVESVWMEVITVDVPDDYSPNRSTWYLNLIRF